MALINNNFNILPWYTSLAHQDYKKWYAFGEKWPLIVPTKKLVPFQFVVSKTGIESIGSIKLIPLETGSPIDTSVTPISLENAEKGYTVIMVPPSICDLSVTTPEGLYYLELVVDDVTYYSDVFCYTSDLSECLKITYWNTDTLFYNGGEINFANDFKYELYIRATVGKPAYEFEEELTTRLGYKFLESQISNKLYRFNFLAPEYICDAMRLIRLSDYIHIESALGSYNAISFSYEPTWEEQGNLASVAVEFTTDTIIQKLPSFNRNQRENFYNALLSSTGEPVLFDEDVVAQYYSSYEDAIKGKLVRDLSEADVSEISPTATTIVDLGSGAAMRVNLLKLFAKFGSSSSGVDTAAFNELVARVNHLKTRADGLQKDIEDVQDDVTTILNDYVSKSVVDKQEIVSPLYVKNALTMNRLYLPNENNEPSSYELKVGTLGAGADTPEGGGSGGIGKVSIYLGAGTTPYDSDAEGKVVLPSYPVIPTLAKVATSGSYNDLSDKPTIPSAVTESTVSGWGFTKNTGTYSKPSTGIPKSDLANAVQTSLGKADTALQEHQDISHLATKTALQAVADDVKALNDILGITEEADDVINSWGEVVAFLDGYGKNDDLADILSGMNGSITANATDITNLKTRADGLQGNIEDLQDDVTTILNDYLSKANGGTIKGAVTIQAALKMNTLYLPNSNNTPSDYQMSVGALGSGADTPSGGSGGIGKVSIYLGAGTTPYDSDAEGKVVLPAYPTSLPASDVYDWAKAATKPSYAFNEITSKPTTLAGYGITDAYTASTIDTKLAGYLPLSGGTITNDLNILTGDSDKFINWIYTVTSTIGASWRLGMAGGGTGNTNYFTLQSGTSATGTTVWYDVLKFGQNDFTAYFSQVPYVGSNAVIHAGTISNYNAGSATKLQTARTIWGQSFDGTGNVRGAITDVTSLRYNVNKTYGIYVNGSVFTSAAADDDVVISSLNKTILYGGNVLIGTPTDSGHKLQVEGTGDVLNLSNSSGGDVALRFSRGTKTSWSIINSGGNLRVVDNFSSTLRMLLYENSQGGGVDITGNLRVGGYSVYHTGNFNPANYLPLSGGTVGKGTTSLAAFNVSTDNSLGYPAIGFYSGDTRVGLIRITGDRRLTIYDSAFNAAATVLTSINYSDYALPLSGGTIEGGANALKIKRNGPYLSCVEFSNTDGSLGSLGFVWGNNPSFFHTDGNYYPLIHSGNIKDYNAGSATKLSDNTAFTAWGKTFFEGGKPKNVSGNISGNYFHIEDRASNPYYKLIDSDGQLGYFQLLPYDKGVAIGSTSSLSLVVSPSGYVGIGSESPQYKLDVYGNARFGTGSGCDIWLNRTSGNSYIHVVDSLAFTTGNKGSANIALELNADLFAKFYGNISASGNIYLQDTTGTSSTSYKLWFLRRTTSDDYWDYGIYAQTSKGLTFVQGANGVNTDIAWLDGFGNFNTIGNISASGIQLPTSAPSNPASGGYYLYVGTLGAGATIS